MLAQSIPAAQEPSIGYYPLPLPRHLQNVGLAQCLVVFSPAIENARNHMRSAVRKLAELFPYSPFDTATIEESLALNLADPLLQISSRVFALELNVARLQEILSGDTPAERFLDFIELLHDPAFGRRLLSEYPVLAEQVADRLDQSVRLLLEFLERLCTDWEDLHHLFSSDPGHLVAVKAGAGDTHRDGRSVIVASFASGRQIVYKPRSLAADQHFQEFLQWLNEQGAQPQFPVLRIVNKKDYGWSEFVSRATCSSDVEIARFYRRQGGYLAILHTMGASDFHCENLIAAGEYPVLIDLEALFHQHPDELVLRHADDIAGAALSFSVLGVGLLPQRFLSNGANSGIDLSGLANSDGQLTPGEVPRWALMNTDEMHVVRKRVPVDGAENCPTFHGQEINACEHSDSIASGFADMYRLLSLHRSQVHALLDRFRDDKVRLLARTTQSYSTLLYESFHPDLLRDAGSRAAHFEHLDAISAGSPSQQKLVPAERRDLLRGDIPLFVTTPSSCDIYTSDDLRLERYFSHSALSLAQARLDQLSENDLQKQLWIVNASLATLASAAQTPKKQACRRIVSQDDTVSPNALIAAASKLAGRLNDLLLGDVQEATWLGLTLTGDKQWLLAPLGPDLYDGLPGVILFLSYLAALTNDASHKALAERAFRALRRQLKSPGAIEGIGAFAGWGGIIYLLTHLAVLWNDDSLFLEAEGLVALLAPLIQRDKQFDIIAGSAGCLLALLALNHCKPSIETQRLARACGDHLLDKAQRYERGIGWRCVDDVALPLTGFAHGNAGIGYALSALAAATCDNRFREAAHLGFEYERALYNPQHRNWPDLRGGSFPEFDIAWCHGAPGIGLSRLYSLPFLVDSAIHGEIEVALETTMAHRFGQNDSLCHGDLGKADILLCAARKLADDAYRVQAAQIASSLIRNLSDSPCVCGNPMGIETPGLMTGISGIGYALLRHIDPQRVPSVLALESPYRHV